MRSALVRAAIDAVYRESARWTVEAKAGGEQGSERTPRCVSDRRNLPTRASGVQRGAATSKKPPTFGLGLWIDISRFAPPTVRRIATNVRSLGRLTGRPMRPESAIADLLVRGPRPLVSRTAGV